MSEPTTTPAGPTTSSTDRGAPAVAVEDLTIRFATDGAPVDAVRGVSLHVDPGEILAIVGESGSGKTVTARTVLRLLPETATVEGAVILAGHDVLTLSGSLLARQITLPARAAASVPARPAAPTWAESTVEASGSDASSA